MITQRTENNTFIIDFSDMEDWTGFDKIISILKNNFNIRILDKNDGPESRVWHLEIDEVKLSLHNNPYGNYLKAASPESVNYLKDNFEVFRMMFY